MYEESVLRPGGSNWLELEVVESCDGSSGGGGGGKLEEDAEDVGIEPKAFFRSLRILS